MNPGSPLCNNATFYHIETDGHEAILAEGAPAETFVDNVARTVFDNYDEYVELYGEPEGRMEESPLPRAMSRRQVPSRIKKMIAKRAAVVLPQEKVA